MKKLIITILILTGLILTGCLVIPSTSLIAQEQNFSFDKIEGIGEIIDRALIALPQNNNSVYLGWRLFKGENPNIKFNLYRKEKDSSEYRKIAIISNSTNYLDKEIEQGKTYNYLIKGELYNKEGESSNKATVKVEGDRNYISIPMPELYYGASKLVMGDLNGDGKYDYVFRTPASYCDVCWHNFKLKSELKKYYETYQHHHCDKEIFGEKNNCIRVNEETPYNLKAYNSKGEYLWSFDIGYNDEHGNDWVHPYIIWDIDKDNKAEIITKIKRGYTYYLAVIDGETGEIKKKTEFPKPWSGNENRSIIAIAYLNGKDPSIIVQHGMYYPTKLQAYNKDLNPLWKKVGLGDSCAGHSIEIIDYDNDGNDEIVQGLNMIDENGNLVWTLNNRLPHFHKSGWRRGTVDMMLPGNIDYDNPGLEIVYGIEAYVSGKGSVSVVDLSSGKIISILKGEEYEHFHGCGWTGELSKEWPGWEIYANNSHYDHDGDGEPDFPNSDLILSSKMEIIRSTPWADVSFSGITVWWENKGLYKLFRTGAFFGFMQLVDHNSWWHEKNYSKINSEKIKHSNIMTGDIIGDNRDDIVVVMDEEVRIYTNTELTDKKYPTPLQDRYYRNRMSQVGVGYCHHVRLLDPESYYSETALSPDINSDEKVDVRDFGIILSFWNKNNLFFQGNLLDFNGDGKIGNSDIEELLEWFIF